MYNVNPDDKMTRLATDTLASMGLEPVLAPSGGGTDANVMRRQGIDCVVVGMSTNEMHTVREYVVIPDLVNTATFCQKLLTETG